MTSRIFITTTLVIFAASLTACSPGFSGANSAAGVGSSSDGSGGTPVSGGGSGNNTTPGNANQAFQNASMDAKISGSTANNSLAVSLDKPNMQLVIRLPLILSLGGVVIGNQLQISQLPGTTLGFETTGTMTALTLRIPLKYVMHGASFLPPGQLPNGDSLATVGIPGGEIPTLGIALNNSGDLKASLFLDPTVVGLFLTSPVNPFIAAEFPIKLADQSTVGFFSTVPAKGQFPGGFFVSVKVPNDIADIIDDVID